MRLALIAAVALLVLWAVLLLALPPAGWVHVALALGTSLLVRAIALES